MTAETHMGQPPASHVILELVGGLQGGCGPAELDFVRITPDGKTEIGSGGGWRVPDDNVLVVTDVDWEYVHPDRGNAAGSIEILRLLVQNIADPSYERRVFESTVTLSSKGEAGISEAMTSGFLVSSAARICPDVFPGPVGPPSGLQHLILRGYLTSGT